MSQSAAAWFLPREAFVENRYVKALARKALAAKRAGGSASDNRDVFHGPGGDPVVTRILSAETQSL